MGKQQYSSPKCQFELGYTAIPSKHKWILLTEKHLRQYLVPKNGLMTKSKNTAFLVVYKKYERSLTAQVEVCNKIVGFACVWKAG
jgi:hypothetical protein